jgi:hypothetical protein
MRKLNCWEFKQCGRGPSAKNQCAAATDGTFNGMHDGINSGRACWVTAGSAGEGPVTGTFAITLKSCLRCDFFKQVESDERVSESGFSATRLGMLKIMQAKKEVSRSSTGTLQGSIAADLRNEFVQELNSVMSNKSNKDSTIIREFSEEVKRLAAEKEKKRV